MQTATQVCSALTGLGKLVCQIHQFLNSLIPVLLALGVVYFVWGVVQYVIGDDEEAKSKGKDRIIYGIIGFAVILSLFGLVNMVVNFFGVGGSQLNVPTLAPVTTPAAGSGGCTMGGTVQGVLDFGTCIINNSIIPFLFALAILFFIWGAIKFFILNADEEAQRAQGKQFMIWGIIALTVMISVWGLVGILGDTFNVGGDVLPQVKPPGQATR